MLFDLTNVFLDPTTGLDVIAAAVTTAYVLKLIGKLSAIERSCLFDGFLGRSSFASASYLWQSGLQKRSLLNQQVMPRA